LARRLYRCLIAVALVTWMVTTFSLGTRAQTLGAPERFSATAVNVDAGNVTHVEIAVTRWSTDAESDRLFSVLFEKGPDQLVDALRGIPEVGFISANSGLGWPLRYARHVLLPDGGEQVNVATDRPMSLRETVVQPPRSDYPITLIELHLDKVGAGVGKISVATRITANKETKMIELENWDLQPVLLEGVRRESPGH
jgi:hypothetical protein